MKQINFKEIPVEVEIGRFEKQDFRKVIGNALHSQAKNLEMDQLARKIFNSNGPIEIAADEFEEMMMILSPAVYYRVESAIRSNAKEVESINVKEIKDGDH